MLLPKYTVCDSKKIRIMKGLLSTISKISVLGSILE